MGRTRFLRALAWVAALGLLAGLVGACAPQQEAAKAPAAKTRVVVATGVDTLTLDPFQWVIITPDKQISFQIYDGLTKFDQSGKLVPLLAESWKNLDDRTWQFKLRQGVKFHNGEPFDAEAVKFTVEAMQDPATKAPRVASFTFIDKVEILDQYTVNLRTKVPTFTTPGEVTSLGIVPPKYAKEKGLQYLGQNPVGTGPYKFVEWVKDDHVTLAANKEYWQGAPKIETVIWRPIKEAAARVGALIAGEVDVAVNVPPEMVPDIEKSGRAVAKPVPSLRIFNLGMSNLDKSLPTANKLVRQALNYAIDRESLVKNIQGGYGKAASGWNPTTFGFNADLKPIPYDPKKAKELLAQAGYPNGFSVVMDSPDSRYPKDKEMAQAIAGQLAEVGVKVEVKTYEWGIFTKRVWDHKTSPLVLFAWVDLQYDPQVIMLLTIKTGALWSQFTSPALDGLINQAVSTMDAEKRKKLLSQVQELMRDESPYAYIAHIADITGVAKDVDWSPWADETIWLFSKPGG